MKENAINLTFLFCVMILLIGCTITTTKIKDPVINNWDELKKELTSLVKAQNINLTGREITSNRKTITEMEITITNGLNIPQEDELRRTLGRFIAKHVKLHLKDSTEFEFYKVKFVIEKIDGALTKSSWIAYRFNSGEVTAPIIQIGKKLTWEYGYPFGGSVFTNKDSEIIFVLSNFTFTDTTNVSMRLYRQLKDSEENIGESLVKVNPFDIYLSHKMDVRRFYDSFGAGKFRFQVLTHDTIIASEDFELK